MGVLGFRVWGFRVGAFGGLSWLRVSWGVLGFKFTCRRRNMGKG